MRGSRDDEREPCGECPGLEMARADLEKRLANCSASWDTLKAEHAKVVARAEVAEGQQEAAMEAAAADTRRWVMETEAHKATRRELDVVKAQRDTAAADLAAWRAESRNVRDAWQKLTDLAPSTCSCPDFELVRAEGCKCGAEDRWRAMREAINRLGTPPHEPGELERLRRWKADAIAAWAKFLRAPTDAESDEGSQELDRLMDPSGDVLDARTHLDAGD